MKDAISVHVTVRKPADEMEPLETKVQPNPEDEDGMVQVRTVYTIKADGVEEAKQRVESRKMQDGWEVVSFDDFEKK